MSGFFIKNFIIMKKIVTIQVVAGCLHEAAAKE